MELGLLTELTKKDDDVEVLDEYTIVTSNPDLEFELEDDDIDVRDPDMLLDEANGPRMDIVVQVTRVVFMVNAICSMLLLTGYVPYQFLRYDEHSKVRYIILGIWLVLCLTGYICMAVWRRSRMAVGLFIAWYIAYYILVIDIAAILHQFTPLQFGLITFAQSLYLVVYTVWSPNNVDPWKSFYVMLLMGLVAWSMGIYAFVLQNDWISAGILLVAMVLCAAYSAVEVHYMVRYSVSYEDYVEAIIRFYADPLIWGVEKIKTRFN